MFEVSTEPPALVCPKCEEDLINAAKFKKISLASDVYFKSVTSSDEQLKLLSNAFNSTGTEQENLSFVVKLEPQDYLYDEFADTSMNYDPTESADDKYIDEKFTIAQNILKIEDPERDYEKKSSKSRRGRPRKGTVSEPLYCHVENCGKPFQRPSDLKRHLIFQHPSYDPQTFQCDQCGKTFTNIIYLRQHKKRHEDVNYTCDLCGFISRGGKMCVLRHMRRVHLKSITAMCNICGKVLSSKVTLKTHMLYSHGGSKDFECHICLKRYYTKGKLNQHLDTHSVVRPYVCQICNSSYAKRYKLSDHMKYSHKMKLESEQKPICTYCGQSFEAYVLLQQHLMEKHGSISGISSFSMTGQL